MASTIGTHALERAVTGMSLGIISRFDRAQRDKHRDSLGEYEQQYQVPFTVIARSAPAWATAEVRFDIPFVNAAARDSTLEHPHFTYGSVILSGTPVMVYANVMAWKTDEQGATEGAVVAIGAHHGNPALVEVAAKGAVHLSFQGYGALLDELGEPDIDGSVG